MLTFAILLPLIGSLVLAFAPRLDGSVARASAVGTSVLPLAALVMVSLDFDASGAQFQAVAETRSEEHTSELQSLMRISYAVFCLKKKKNKQTSIRLILTN